jgi:hypothetical protein
LGGSTQGARRTDQIAAEATEMPTTVASMSRVPNFILLPNYSKMPVANRLAPRHLSSPEEIDRSSANLIPHIGSEF